MWKHSKLEWIIAFAVLLGIVYGSYTLSKKMITEPAETELVRAETVQVIVDAGHGGSDPGKVGINEVKERDVNLSIALKVKARLEKEGIRVLMTREEDKRTDEKGQEYSKAEDMKSRVNMINETKPEMVVSIHQNSYQSEEIRGAQVFYYVNSEKAKEIAQIMQEELRALDPMNDRQIKANDTYYMLKRTEVPTVIVECGFLTNWEEANKLIDDEYQNKVADAIVSGIKKCLENKIATISI